MVKLFRWGVALAVVGVAAAAALLGGRALTASGWAWVGLVGLLGVGLCPLEPKWRRSAWLALAVASLVVVGLRLAPRGGGGVRVVTLSADGRAGPAPLLDRLFDERDAALVGSRLLVHLGLVRAPEFPTLPAVLEAAYAELSPTTSFAVTPVVTTLLGLESPGRSTMVVVEPPRQATVGVLFLHGFGGNFVLQCAAVARALPEALTVCPSTTFTGAWWTADGEAVVRAALRFLDAQGVSRVVLAGLSNGGAGASLLLPKLEGRVDAAILLSGVSPRAPTPAVPTVVVQGRADGMMPTPVVRAWVAAHAVPTLQYLELPGTHFALLEQAPAVGRAAQRLVAASVPHARQELQVGRVGAADRARGSQ